MKVTVTKFLNVRVGSPGVNAPCYQYLAPGTVLEVDGKVYKGDMYDSVDTWLKDEVGNYYWTGGFEEKTLKDNLAGKSAEGWWLTQYRIADLWAMGLSGKSVKIAVLDTGISYPHPDLEMDENLFIDATGSPSRAADQEGHGTHCAGIIKAVRNTTASTGIAHGASVYPVKINHDLYGDKKEYLKAGLEKAIAHNVDIISISHGRILDPGSEVESLVAQAISKGILVVCAAGNRAVSENPEHIYYPARYKDVVSVGAVDENRLPLNSSILTGETTVFAPGKDILSTYLRGGYLSKSGSSQATPYVAAVCALALEKKRKSAAAFRAIDLKQDLLSSSEQMPYGKLICPFNFLSV